MLLLGSDFMAQSFDAQYRLAAQSANRKIEGVLPEKLRDDVHYLQNSIRFIATGTIKDEREAEMIRKLRRAIIDSTTVRFCYHTRYAQSGKSEQLTREADPYGLVHIHTNWLLVAYCHLRKGMRNFRLDRVDTLELLPTTFVRPPDFKMERSKDEDRNTLLIRALFDYEVARWVLESRSYYMTSAEETAEGLLVTLKVRQENEILQWLLSWGRHVRVLEPASVREQLLEEARGMIGYYGEGYEELLR